MIISRRQAADFEPPDNIRDNIRRISLSDLPALWADRQNRGSYGQHDGVVPFEAIGAPAGFTFIDLPKTRRFVCRECGAREVQVMPDWPPYLARR